MMIPSRRHLLSSLISLFGLSGCSSSPLSLMQSTVEAISLLANGYPDVALSRSQINALPYACIQVKIGRGPRSLLVLGRQENDDLHWISADQAVIITRRGHIVRTVGLGTNLRGAHYLSTPLMPMIHSQSRHTQYQREIDIEHNDFYQVNIQSNLQYVGEETITILGIAYSTLKIQEYCKAPFIEWQHMNTYWISPEQGVMWRSLQHFAPDMPAASIEILKRPTQA